jgi:hypothetical protein
MTKPPRNEAKHGAGNRGEWTEVSA